MLTEVSATEDPADQSADDPSTDCAAQQVLEGRHELAEAQVAELLDEEH
jgi:hypothetical protein